MSDHDLAPSWLTPSWIGEVLGAEVTGLAVRRIGDGLVGMNLRLGVQYASPSAEGPTSLVVKLPSPDETSRATGIALRNYEREVFFYRDLAGTLDVRVAECHHASWDPASGDFVLLLEDLAPAAQGNQITGCTPEQARDAVVELAAMHGPRWDDPSLHDVEWLSRRASEADTQGLAMMWNMLVPGFLATYAKHIGTEGVEVVERFGPLLPAWADSRLGAWTVTHGDYRLDNLMFATPDGGSPVAVVDWQSPGHGPGVGDLSYFLGAGLLPPERRTHEHALVDAYAAALDGYGVALPADDLWSQYRRDTFCGVIMSVIASQIVGANERSEAMFAAMASRHTQHVIDLDAFALL